MTIPDVNPAGTVLARETVYDGPVFSVEKLKIETPEKTVIERDFIRHADAVVILAITSTQQVVLTHEYRVGAGGIAYALPAGLIDASESPEDAAKRELREETGFEALSLTHMTAVRSSEGMTNELVHLFYAEIGDKPTKSTDFDADEYVSSELVPLDEVSQAVRDGRIASAPAVSAVAYYLTFLTPTKEGERNDTN